MDKAFFKAVIGILEDFVKFVFQLGIGLAVIILLMEAVNHLV